LKRIIDNKLLTANGVFGIFPAQSNGDDVQVFADEERNEPLATFFGLRQQEEKVTTTQRVPLGRWSTRWY
jgi:5-methyltetrahydrofolate--homocysteine methyltransferase